MSKVENPCVVKRRPRIIAIQKKLLVQLVENHFIRTTGHCSNVDLQAIDLLAYEGFAEVLNTWGPSKTPCGWKSSFCYMKNRIRRSVELILQSNARVKDNLSDLDFKLYSMSPSWFHGVQAEKTREIEITNDFADDDVRNTEQEENSVDFEADCGYYAEEQELDSENLESKYHVLVAENAEDLEWYSPIILSDEEELRETICPVTDTDTQHDTVTLDDWPEESYSNVHGLPPHNPKVQSVPCSAAKRIQEAPKSKIIKAKPATKPVSNSKITELQKERLVQIVQNNFLKAFGRFTGADGAHIKIRFWESAAKELNTMGSPRTAEQWKTAFTKIKTSAKAKLADDHNNIGGLVTKPLTRLEEKVLSIYGMNALDGSQQLGEGGFRYKKTVPTASRAVSSTVTSGAFENLSANEENQQVTVEMSTNHNEPEAENGANDLTSLRHDDDDVLRELIDEIWAEPDTETQNNTPAPRSAAVVNTTRTLEPQRSVTQTAAARSAPVVASNSRIHSEIRSRESNNNSDSASASRPRTNASRSHGSSHALNSTRISRGSSNGGNYPNRPRASSNGVSGVPRLHVRRRRRSSSNEEITNISQFFNDEDSEEEGRRNSGRESRRENANTRSRNTNEENSDRSVARVERDRSNLRHRYTSFEMVQQSLQAQERFIEDNNRNHSELLYANDRNHIEMIGIYNATLRTLADIGQQLLNKM